VDRAPREVPSALRGAGTQVLAAVLGGAPGAGGAQIGDSPGTPR